MASWDALLPNNNAPALSPYFIPFCIILLSVFFFVVASSLSLCSVIYTRRYDSISGAVTAMGKYMKKAKITGEIAVMEFGQSSLGVRTRAKTLALQRLQNATVSSTSYLQLRSRRLEKPPIAADAKKTKDAGKETPKLRLPACSANSVSVGSISESCSNKKSDAAAAPASSVKEDFLKEASPDNEVGVEVSFGETDGRERSTRETTPCSLIRGSDTLGTPGSTTRPTNSTMTNRRAQNTMHRNIPTAREMDEFFAGAEQQQQRIFTEKYNYDPVNDVPLPGRFEWERLDL